MSIRFLPRRLSTSWLKTRGRRGRVPRNGLSIDVLEDRTLLSLTPTTTSLLTDTVNAVFGQKVTLSVTVATDPPSATTPTGGTVTFKDGATTLGSAPISNGAASLSTTALPVGANTVTAVYSGDGSQFGGSASGVGSNIVTVAKTPTTASLTISNPSPIFGESVTLTVTVTANTPSLAVPTGGLVTFADGNTVLGTAKLVNGTAALSTVLGRNQHVIAAAYSGDGIDFNPSVFQNPGLLVTTAGNINGGYFGDGGSAIGAGLYNPLGMIFDGDGNLIIADSSNHVIRMVTPKGVISTYAGTGGRSYTGDGGSALLATFGQPWGLAFDAKGDLFISDATYSVVREILTTGKIITVAGNGVPGSLGDGGPATSAQLNNPEGLTFDSAGNLYIADAGNDAVRKVDATGKITTVAGEGTPGYGGDGKAATSALLNHPTDVRFGPNGNLYIADLGNGTIREVLPDGTIASVVGYGVPGHSGDGGNAVNAQLGRPTSIAFDAQGDLFIADGYLDSQTVREVKPNGIITPVAGGGTIPDGFSAVDPLKAAIEGLACVAVNPFGTLYISETNLIRAVENGIKVTVLDAPASVALTSSPAPSAFGQPVTFTATISAGAPSTLLPTQGSVSFYDGNTDLGDVTLNNSNIATLTIASLAPGTHSITAVFGGGFGFATATSDPYSQLVSHLTSTSLTSDLTQAVYGQPVKLTATVVTAPSSSLIPTGGTVSFIDAGKVLGSAPLINGTATLSTPLAVGLRYVTATYQGDGANFSGSSTTNLEAIITVAGNGTHGYSGDGGMATNATLFAPGAIVRDSQGDLYIADTTNNVIREVKTNGVIVTIAGTGAAGYAGDGGFAINAQLNQPSGLAIDAQGNLYIADTGNNVIREITLNGMISTVAGNGEAGDLGDNGPATSANLNTPIGLAFDRQGNLLIADSINNRVREVEVGGTIITFAGTGSKGFAGDDGPATSAKLFRPSGVAVDANGNVYIADTGNMRVRKVTLDGIIHTAAGIGTQGDLGDGGPATNAELAQPGGVGVDAAGHLFIADTDNNVIREVTLDGTITTVAGSGTPGFSGDNGPPTSAGLRLPSGVTFDSAGDLYIADTGNNAIRAIPNGRAITVDPGPTTTTVTASASSVVFGQSVTFTATVTPTSPSTLTPGSATVTFYGGFAVLGTAKTDSKGVATFTTSALAVGNHSISAVYAGDTNSLPSTSNTVNVAVVRNTNTALASSGSPSVVGQSVTFTATVSADGSNTAPTGTVTFKDGATTLGTAPLNSSGVATFSSTSLTVGTHTITAAYGGDFTNLAGSSTPLSQVVNQDSTTVALTSSANPSLLGKSINLQATVTIAAPGAGKPTGTVTFEDGATVLGTASIDGTGNATFSIASLTAGAHALTAIYGGDANDLTSSSLLLTQNVQQNTTTTLTSSANPAVLGQTVTLTATVTPVGTSNVTPSGTVTFRNGAVILGKATLDSTGTGTLKTATLGLATHSITVDYAGDLNDLPSHSSTIKQVVKKDGTAISLTASANPAVAGQSVTLKATISATKPGAGVPAGSITFKNGTTVLGTAKINAAGVASFSTGSLSPGLHSITAAWGGGAKYLPSTSAALKLNIKRATSSALSSSVNPAVFGQSVTFTATVTPRQSTTAIPTGTVAFMDGSTLLGKATLVKGVARFSTAKLSPGNHTIAAVYSSDGTFAKSTSTALKETVKKAATTTTVKASANPATVGQPVTVSTTVAAASPGSGIPTGSVTFKDGSTTLGSASLVGGKATWQAPTGFALGTHSITIVYGGDGHFTGSTSKSLKETIK